MATQTARKGTAPAFDASALSVADAELPKQTRSGTSGPNPFVPVLTASRDNGNAGKAVTVPAANVGQVQYLIRRAAAEIGVGARVVLRDSKGATLDKDAMKALASKNKSASVTVLFAAKQRKAAPKSKSA